MAEQSARMREDLLKQFSSADAHNPLADFKAGTMAAMRRAAEQQDTNLKALNEQIAALKGEVVKLQAEREKRPRSRPSTRARPPRAARTRRPCSTPSTRSRGRAATTPTRSATCPAAAAARATSSSASTAATGPPRARIVFEAKNAYVPKNKAVAELDAAMEQRDADYAVWVVPSEELLPGRGAQLREVNGDKLFVVFDPDDGARLGLEVAYALARARTLMVSADGDGLDAGALRTEIERALAAMDDVRRIKTQLTGAAGGIEAARKILDDMAERVRGHLAQVDALVAAGTGDDCRRRRAAGLTVSSAPRARPRQAWRSLTAAPVRRIAPE